ncbi:MAG: hypothetical protein CL916_14230, partial [Deltaproteobacteria bacterium]|nr:hypothetical protein [Deltaproteobacteria bacterium]
MEFSSFIDEYQKIVEQYPHHTAIEMNKKSYTHLEMWRRSSSIAHTLSDLPKHSRIGAHIPKSFDLVAAMLGCWMRGLVFIPLDPSLPSKRIEEYIHDAQIHRILSAHTTQFKSSIYHPLPTYDSSDSLDMEQITADDGAYIIYSSGSTGRPKGVLVSHRGLVLVLSQQIKNIGLTPNDRCF